MKKIHKIFNLFKILQHRQLSTNLKLNVISSKTCNFGLTSREKIRFENECSIVSSPRFNVASACVKKRLLSSMHENTDANVGHLLRMTPNDFLNVLKRENISRCFIVNNKGRVRTSHELMEDMWKQFDNSNMEYDKHEAIFFARGARTDTLMSVFIWRTNRGQAAGGVDLRPIKSMADLVADGNRLSWKLGIKSALAGVWAGGGKGIIAAPTSGDKSYLDPEFRQQVFMDFGDFLTSLNGAMIGCTGIGSSVADMDTMFAHTRYVSNLTADYGGTADSARYTGLGVVKAMEAAIEFLQMGSLEGKTVAIQGAGDVGEAVIDELLEKGVRHIHASECNTMRADDVRDIFAHKADGRLTVSKVSFEDTSIFCHHCDIFSPCASGAVLNKNTIPLLDTKIICGSSNANVDSEEDHLAIMEKKITYVTDVVPNRMGIVSKLLEHYGRLDNDPILNKHLSTDWEHSIYQTTLRILELAAKVQIHPEKAANILGEELSLENHPLYPNRTADIIKGLVDFGWHEGKDFWRSRQSFLGSTNTV